MRLIIPLLLLLLGVSGGAAAGFVLRPEPELPAEAELAEGNPCGDAANVTHGSQAMDAETEGREYVKLNNQFVVPIVSDNRVNALIVLSLSIEVVSGSREEIYTVEPKLRDVFLQVLFEHANLGGFDGAFTEAKNLGILRRGLRTAASKIMPERITDVLIVDIVRQDN